LITCNLGDASDWYAGIPQFDEMPPPLAPYASFQTVSIGGGPSAVRDVPPTLVTYGWLPGSSTALTAVGLSLASVQSVEPSSPDEATTV
jgi:hypothetical protein